MKRIVSYRFLLLIVWMIVSVFQLFYTIVLVKNHITNFQALVLLGTSLLNAIVVALIWIGSFKLQDSDFL